MFSLEGCGTLCYLLMYCACFVVVVVVLCVCVCLCVSSCITDENYLKVLNQTNLDFTSFNNLGANQKLQLLKTVAFSLS